VDLGIPGQWNAPVMLDAIRATAAACRKHGKIMGCHTDNLDNVDMLRQMGVQMFGFQCDIGIYSHAAASVVSEFTRAVR
jgi:2-keto-3-deoxy-L-rhamnonate aldolase RhmA